MIEDKEIREVYIDFAGDAATQIYANSFTPNDFLSQLKTYHNIELESSGVALRIFVLEMFVELLISRISDLVEPIVLNTVENECISKLVYWFEILDVKKNEEEFRKDFSSMIINDLRDHRAVEKEQNITIPMLYISLIYSGCKEKLSEEICRVYVENKIELFEGINLRKKLMDALENLKE